MKELREKAIEHLTKVEKAIDFTIAMENEYRMYFEYTTEYGSFVNCYMALDDGSIVFDRMSYEIYGKEI